jgi:hypothetical protein
MICSARSGSTMAAMEAPATVTRRIEMGMN